MKKTHVLLLIVFILYGCIDMFQVSTEENEKLIIDLQKIMPDPKSLITPLPGNLAALERPEDPISLPITDKIIALGSMIYFEDSLGKGGNIQTACSNCHIGKNGFNDDTFPSEDHVEVPSKRLPMNTPTSMIGDKKKFLWSAQLGEDYRLLELDSAQMNSQPLKNNFTLLTPDGIQFLAALEAHGLRVTPQDLAFRPDLKKAFIEAYSPHLPGLIFDMDNQEKLNELAGIAVGYYQRSIQPYGSAFQEFISDLTYTGKSNALSPVQIKGAIKFFSYCYQCHESKYFGSDKVYDTGIADASYYWKEFEYDSLRAIGRANFTKKEQDLYRFATPNLYTVSFKDDNDGRFTHSGAYNKLENLIKHKLRYENHHAEKDSITEQYLPLGSDSIEGGIFEHGFEDIETASYQIEQFLHSLRPKYLEAYIPDGVSDRD